MNDNLTYFLTNRFPTFFNNPNNQDPYSKFRGFECRDGWFQIIYNSCISIDNHINSIKIDNIFREKMKKLHDDGGQLSDHFQEEYNLNQISPLPVPDFMAIQVKEKFGSIRFYSKGADSYIRGVLSSLSNNSSSTCEICGNKGSLIDVDYIQTLCPEHSKHLNIPKSNVETNSIIKALYQSTFKHFKVISINHDNIIAVLVEKSEIENNFNNNQDTYIIKERKSDMFSFFEAVKNN